MSEHNYKDIWQEAMRRISEEYKASGKDSDFQLWFNMEYVEDFSNTITVSVPSTFMWSQMQKRGHVKIVENKICELTGQKNIEIISVVKAQESNDFIPISQISAQPSEEKKETSPAPKMNPNIPLFSALKEGNIGEITAAKVESPINPSESKKQEKKESIPIFQKHPQLREDYTFDAFVPGENSALAYKVCLEAAKNPGNSYNPILIYGGVGLGKTHLMQSIGNYIYKEKGSASKICCVSAEEFTNDFIQSLRDKVADKFKNKYRKLDVLLIDDIHFLQEKDGTQEELFYTFNALFDNKAQLVFTCDRPITELKNITDRLKSRFSLGMNVDIQMPNYETRRAILTQKLSAQGKELPDDVIDYIAKNVQTNVRDLQASLTKMLAYSELIGSKLTIEIAQQQLRDTFSSPISGTISIDTIQKVVADQYAISLSDLKGRKRDRKYVKPRQIALYIARQLTEYSLKELGNEFGGKDHSTVMHSLEKIEDELKTDSQLNSMIQLLIRNIKDYKK